MKSCGETKRAGPPSSVAARMQAQSAERRIERAALAGQADVAGRVHREGLGAKRHGRVRVGDAGVEHRHRNRGAGRRLNVPGLLHPDHRQVPLIAVKRVVRLELGALRYEGARTRLGVSAERSRDGFRVFVRID